MLKNVASMQIQKVATFNSDRKIINVFPNKSFENPAPAKYYLKKTK